MIYENQENPNEPFAGSNWPDFGTVQTRLPEVTYFIDNSNWETVAEFKDLQTAVNYIQRFGGTLRVYEPNNDQYEDELAAQRIMKRLNPFYK